MHKLFLTVLAALALLGAGVMLGQKTVTGQKTLIHTISFKQVEGTTPQQMREMFDATLKMAAEVPGMRRVWVGKVTNRGEDYTHGIVMEFENAEALKNYAPHAAHKKWEEIYFKVRQPGSNTIDVQGE